MPPVNDSNIPTGGSANAHGIVNGSGNSNEENISRKFTFPSHQFHMVHLAKMCQENKEYTDCVIRVGDSEGQQGQELRAHRLVLGSVSPFLKLVFADLPQNHTEATILVPGVHRRVVKALLDFFYTGQMTVERKDTSDLQLLIDTLQIDPGLITVDTVSNPDPAPTLENKNKTEPEKEKEKEKETSPPAPAPTTKKQNEKPPTNKAESSVVDNDNSSKQDSDNSQENSSFFDRLIDRKRKSHDDGGEFSTKKRIHTNESEVDDEEASK